MERAEKMRYEGGMLALAILVAASTPVDANAASLITEIVTASLAKDTRLEVLASSDVRRELEVDAEKQVTGCSEKTSCLAEVAGALGAQLVVYGKLGVLDDDVILTLNLFDSKSGQAGGRVVVQDNSLKAVSAKVDGAAHELVDAYLKAHESKNRLKLLVLDVEAPKGGAAADASNAVPGKPMSPLLLGGLGAVAGGVLVGLGGVGALAEGGSVDKSADDLSLGDAPAKNKYAARDAWGATGLIASSVGAIVLVAGLGLVVTSLVTE